VVDEQDIGAEMKRSIATIGISVLLFGVCFASAFLPSAKAEYEWKSIAPAGSGCFPPKCERGKFPMAIVPITGFEGKLYSIGDNRVWTSTDGVKWDSQPKTDWGQRYGMQFAFFKNKLWMFGGMRTWDDFRNDVWSSEDGKTWNQVVNNAAWNARRGHGMVVFNNRMWILGGSISSGRRDQTPTRFLNDVWSSADGVNWEQVTANAPWSPRECGITLVLDNKIWIVGARGKNDIWSSADGREWQQVTANAEVGAREGAGGAAFDGKMWVFGGIEKNDVWSSTDGKTWVRVFESAPWSTRSTVYNTVYKDRLMLFSGKTGRADTQTGEIWAMSRR
jgi:hypothetical protein